MIDSWFVRSPRRPTGAGARVLCFHNAGGGASLYTRWQRHALPGIELIAAQLPGREHRLREPPRTDLAALVEELAPLVLEFSDLPFAVFGHSMGAVIAFELARELYDRGGPAPCHVFVSAHPAPQLPSRRIGDGPADDDRLLELLERYEGIPKDVAANPELMALVLPIMRADLRLLESYEYVPGERLECPLSVFGGREDRAVASDRLAAWTELSHLPAGPRLFPGGHFYLRDAAPALVQQVCRELFETVAGGASSGR